MLRFSVKCETFLRFAGICSFFPETTPEETRREINTVRLENKQGKSYIVATNQKICAVEFLGKTTSSDGICHIKLTPELLKQCEIEAPYDFNLDVCIDEVSVVTTPMGFLAQDVFYDFGYTFLDEWQTWFVEPPKKSSGFMYINLHYLEMLIKCSPSAEITFPEHIDSSKPVVINDRYNKNWMGTFIPQLKPEQGVLSPAKVHEWVGKR